MIASSDDMSTPVLRHMNDRRLLVTISEQKEHLYGLQFVSRFLRDHEGVALELFFMLPPKKSPRLGLYGTPMNEGHMEESIYEMHMERAREAVEEARRKLVSEGFPDKQIGVKYEPPTDQDDWHILDEVERGQFDAIVVGNRGRSWLDSVLEGHMDIGDKLLHSTCSAPLWICPEPRGDSSNVLLCLDGSEISFRMARHVGHMLRREKQHNVMMLRVTRSGPAGTMTPGDIFSRGAQILRDAGMPDERISSNVVNNDDVVQAIINEAESGNHAVVAAGRSGVGKGLVEKIFMGSVTEKLFKKLQDRALWVQC